MYPRTSTTKSNNPAINTKMPCPCASPLVSSTLPVGLLLVAVSIKWLLVLVVGLVGGMFVVGLVEGMLVVELVEELLVDGLVEEMLVGGIVAELLVEGLVEKSMVEGLLKKLLVEGLMEKMIVVELLRIPEDGTCSLEILVLGEASVLVLENEGLVLILETEGLVLDVAGFSMDVTKALVDRVISLSVGPIISPSMVHWHCLDLETNWQL